MTPYDNKPDPPNRPCVAEALADIRTVIEALDRIAKRLEDRDKKYQAPSLN